MTRDKLVVDKEIGVNYIRRRSVLIKWVAFTFMLCGVLPSLILFTFEFLASGETNGLDVLRSHFEKKDEW